METDTRTPDPALYDTAERAGETPQPTIAAASKLTTLVTQKQAKAETAGVKYRVQTNNPVKTPPTAQEKDDRIKRLKAKYRKS